MNPPIDIDLNIPFSSSNDNENENNIPDLNLAVDAEEIISSGEFNFDLNQAPSQVSLDRESPCVEDRDNETEVEILETQPFNPDYSETDGDFQQPIQQVESDESEGLMNSDGTCRRRKFLSNEDREAISRMLLQYSHNGRLKKGTHKLVASAFSVSIDVIKRIWRRRKETGDVSHRKTKNCGRKRVQIDPAQFRQIPFSKRSTLRDLAAALNTNTTSLHRIQKLGEIRRHSNTIKPSLKEENKIARLKFCLKMLENGTVPHDPTFKTMHNIVHIDEKWFYMTKKSMNYYLLPEENDPHRSCKNKNFIGKVMFLVAVTRPRFDAEGNETFDGKIGVFPFVTKEPARRTSVNRVAGTLETKPITSVNREISRMFLIEKVIPAIKEKWPRDDICNPIFIQQDNARCHINENDNEFCQIGNEDGFDIRLMCQPPNSPDLNVLDLGFFASIQALQYKEAPKTIDELIEAVVKAFENFSPVMSNRIFLTLQTCMVEIMKTRGLLTYNIPHIKKAMLEREGRLPTQIKCDPSLVEEVIHYLRTSNSE